MPLLKVRALDLYYERQGAGRSLLFISGTGGDLRDKPNVFDGPLPQSFDVVAYDQRGLGQTSTPDAAWTMADYADDAAALMEAVGWSKALVVGVSFGGMVAQELVCRHPERVEALALCCTSPGGEGGSSFPLHEIWHLEGPELARRMIGILDDRFDEAWAKRHPEAMEGLVAGMSARRSKADSAASDGQRRQLEARAQHDCWDRLQAVSCPTLICGGLYDGLALPAAQRALRDRIPHARLEMFEGGHLFLQQDARALPAIEDFFGSCDAGGGAA